MPPGRPAPLPARSPRRTRPAPPARSRHAPRARSDRHHRRCRWRSLPTTRPTRQSSPWLLLLDACGRCQTDHAPSSREEQPPASPGRDPNHPICLRMRCFISSGCQPLHHQLDAGDQSHASALAMVASKSLASRRLRLSQAKVRSTTQRRGRTTKPGARSDRLTISIVQWPSCAERVAQLLAGIAAIGEDVAQPGERAADRGQQRTAPSRSWMSARWTSGGDQAARWCR